MNNLIHLKAIDDIPLQDVHVSDIVKINEDDENGNFEVVIINRDNNRILYNGKLRDLGFNVDGFADPICYSIILGIKPIIETDTKAQVKAKLEIIV